MRILVTKQFEFQMAHALAQYPGKCRNLHGHNYKLFVTVTHDGDLPPLDNQREKPLSAESGSPAGLVMDFGQVKDLVMRHIVEPFDHALVLPKDSPFLNVEGTKLIVSDFEPTCENLLIHFASLLVPHLPQGIRLHSLKLHETDSSSAELIL